MLEVTGILKKVLPIESGTSKAGKQWQRRSFVIDTEEQYNPLICFGLFGEKATMVDEFNLGDRIKVSFNLSSREYKDNYYTQADAWRVKLDGVGMIEERFDAEVESTDDVPF